MYPDGRVCISILHAPGDDPTGYETSKERWSPVQSIEKILLSVMSMLAGKLLFVKKNINNYHIYPLGWKEVKNLTFKETKKHSNQNGKLNKIKIKFCGARFSLFQNSFAYFFLKYFKSYSSLNAEVFSLFQLKKILTSFFFV